MSTEAREQKFERLLAGFSIVCNANDRFDAVAFHGKGAVCTLVFVSMKLKESFGVCPPRTGNIKLNFDEESRFQPAPGEILATNGNSGTRNQQLRGPVRELVLVLRH